MLPPFLFWYFIFIIKYINQYSSIYYLHLYKDNDTLSLHTLITKPSISRSECINPSLPLRDSRDLEIEELLIFFGAQKLIFNFNLFSIFVSIFPIIHYYYITISTSHRVLMSIEGVAGAYIVRLVPYYILAQLGT